MPNTNNRGTARKLKIIEDIFCKDWRESFPDHSIEKVYLAAIKDTRASLFCKVDSLQKRKLHVMLTEYDTTAGDLIGTMIDTYYELYMERDKSKLERLADDYAG